MQLWLFVLTATLIAAFPLQAQQQRMPVQEHPVVAESILSPIARAALPKVQFDSTQSRGFQLLAMTPNPVFQQTHLTIQFAIFTRHPLRFQLIDITGRRLINEHWKFLQNGKYEVRIPLPPLAAGRYLLILDAIGRPVVVPIIVLR